MSIEEWTSLVQPPKSFPRYDFEARARAGGDPREVRAAAGSVAFPAPAGLSRPGPAPTTVTTNNGTEDVMVWTA